MERPQTLTGLVLTAAGNVRRSYRAHRTTVDTQGQYLSSLLMSYDDISEDQAHLWMCGKRRPPLPLARHYADGASLCSRQLHLDVSAYYMSPAISRAQIAVLWTGLRDVLQALPAADRDDIMATVDLHDDAKTRACVLLTCMLQYAMHMDIAQYTYMMD